MKAREIRQEPIVPAREGRPPGFVVVCLDCPWSHDAHGVTAEEAVHSLQSTHQLGHKLIARAQVLTDHPLYL